MKKLAEKLSTGKTIDPADLKEFKSACKAVNKGTDQWISQIKSIVGSNPSKETTELLASISSAKSQVLEMLDCGNANATPPTPKKGPSWDDNFLLAECDYEKAKSSAGELTKQSDNSKGIFTPPPTDKLTCIVKLSDLKKQLNVTISTFICPDGGLINLDDADEIQFYTYAKSLYPNGSILGVKKGTKNYIARIITYTGTFTGFVDWDIWKSKGFPPDPTFHSTAPELNKDLSVWAIEINESQEVRSIGKADYSTDYYKQGDISLGGRNRLKYGMDKAASSCNFKSNSTDAPAMEGYSSQSGLDDLTKKLKKYGGLGDVIFKITDKDGRVSYVTKDKQYKPNEGTPTGTNGSGKTTFEITEDANGKVDVKGKFKADPSCPKCAGEAEKALNAAIAEMATKHGGKIDPKKNVIESGDSPVPPIGIQYQNMSLAEALAAMAKGYNDLVNNAQVPGAVWKPGSELGTDDKDFPVRDGWGIASGAIDGSINELKDKAQLVGMIMTVVANPKKTGADLTEFAQGVVTDWDKTKAVLVAFGGGMIGYDPEKFKEGLDPVYKGHGTGFMGGTIATQAAMGGVAIVELLKSVKDAPAKLTKRLDNLASALQRVKVALKSKFNWSDAKIDKYDDAIAKTADADDVLNGCNAECVAGKFGCFTANTDVRTPNAFVKADQVTEGMLLQSFNHQTQREEANKVSVVKKRLVSGLLLLTLSTGEVIETTPNHPFYVHHKYENAETLIIGDTLFTNQNLTVTLTGKVSKDTTVTVYNFTVEGNNNYFVGQTNILVHNASCLLDNLEKNFPALLKKFDELTPELQTKFLKDFEAVDDGILKALNEGGVQAWKALPNHEIRLQRGFLEKYNTLSVDKKLKMEEFMANQKKPGGFNTPVNKVNFDVTKSDIDIAGDGVKKSYTVHYDENGFPDFRDYCPDRKFVYKPDDINGYGTLSGKNSDMYNANQVMSKKFKETDGFESGTTGFSILVDNKRITYTWHHHQDAKTMFPVPSKIHTANVGGFSHSGGATLIENYEIIGFFSSPF